MSLFLKVLLILFFFVVFIAALLSLDIKNSLNFDSQELSTWEYSARIGLLPYKDVFYPYGIFSYYYKTVAVLRLIYVLLPLILISGFYFVLKPIIKNKEYLLLSMTFLSAVVLLIGIELFIRYGIFYLLSFLFGQILIKKRIIRQVFFTSGLLSGLVFSFFFDLGIYLIAVSFVFIFIKELLFRKYFSFKSFIFSVFLFSLGTAIGIIPIVIYLLLNNIWIDFIDSFIKIKDFSAYAKTPYLHSLRSWPAIINLLTFITATWFLIYKYLVKKEKITNVTIGVISLSLVFILLLQKSIIRSIDLSIFFICSLILIVIFYEIKIYKNKVFKLLLVLTSLIFLVSFVYREYNYYAINSSDNRLSSYLKIKAKIGNDTIYSYPGDPIYYQIFKQVPPYYFATYESSPLYAQQRDIDYLEDKKIKYIIFNLSNWSVQDGVPNYIRVPYLTKYISNNFSPKYKIDNFLILERHKDKDMFNNDSNIYFSLLVQKLLNVNFENIPKSEGIHKNKYLSLSKKDLSEKTFTELNKKLKKNRVMSRNKLIVLYFKKGNENEQSKLTIKSEDGLKSIVTFKNCPDNYPCIINLANIPLFYKDRIIKEVSLSGPNDVKRVNLTYSADSNFW